MAAGFKGLLRGFHGDVFKTIAQSSQDVISVVINHVDCAAAVYRAG